MKVLLFISIYLLFELNGFLVAGNPKLGKSNRKFYAMPKKNVRGKRLDLGSITITNPGNLNDPCTRNRDCSVENSRCNLGVCKCRNNYVFSNENRTTCYRVKELEQACTIDQQCGFRQECSTECVCQAPYVKLTDDNGGKACYEVSDSLGTECTHPGQCGVENSNCFFGRCGCDNGYTEDGNGRCKGSRVLGNPCSRTSQCAEDNAECSDGSCKCTSLYIRNGLECLPGQLTLGSTCVINAQCADANSECRDGSCKCKSNYIKSGTTCYLGNRPLGSTCSVDSQCAAGNSKCSSGSCECRSGFERSGFTCQTVVPEMSQCEKLGGNCVPKNSRCCPRKLFDDPSLCYGSNTHICCLPASGGGPGSEISERCECNAKHEEVLAAAQFNFALEGSSNYTPSFQVPLGASDRSCLPREPSCGDPANVCLSNHVLNLLSCAPQACNAPNAVWKLHSLLNFNICVGTKCEDLCGSNGVLFERISPGCGFGQLKNMCEDTGGDYTKSGNFVWCLY